MAEEKESGFKVTDRRKFNPDGSPRDQSLEAETAATSAPTEQPQPLQSGDISQGKVVSFPGEGSRKREQPGATPSSAMGGARIEDSGATATAAAQAAEQAYEKASSAAPGRMPERPFLSLVNMLAGEAAMHMGLLEHPAGGTPTVSLEAARDMIDMLGAVEQKTRGNLTAEEDKMLEEILAYLRMQFVALSRGR